MLTLRLRLDGVEESRLERVAFSRDRRDRTHGLENLEFGGRVNRARLLAGLSPASLIGTSETSGSVGLGDAITCRWSPTRRICSSSWSAAATKLAPC